MFLDRHPATNNIVEYEACILGLEIALELGIRQIEDSVTLIWYLDRFRVIGGLGT